MLKTQNLVMRKWKMSYYFIPFRQNLNIKVGRLIRSQVSFAIKFSRKSFLTLPLVEEW